MSKLDNLSPNSKLRSWLVTIAVLTMCLQCQALQLGLSPQHLVEQQDKTKTALVLDAKIQLEKAKLEIEKDPNSAFWRNQASVYFAAIGDFKSAVKEIREAIRLEPDDPINWGFLASYLHEQTQYAEELKALRKALELDPKNPAARLDLAVALEASADFEAAIAEYQSALNCMRYARAQRSHRGKEFKWFLIYYDVKGNAYSVDSIPNEARKRIDALKHRPKPSRRKGKVPIATLLLSSDS